MYFLDLDRTQLVITTRIYELNETMIALKFISYINF